MDNYDAISRLRAMIACPDIWPMRDVDREAIQIALAALEEKEEARYTHTER